MDVLLLKKIVASFMLPPGIFIVFSCIAGFMLIRRKRRTAGMMSVGTGCLLWICSMSSTAHFLMAQIEDGLRVPANPRGDVIIVLGGGVYEQARDFSGVGVPTEDALVRLVTGARLYRRLRLPILVSGGAAAGKVPEALVARRLLLELGVPPDKILVEVQSRDTSENARYCHIICTRRGLLHPLLITSGYHMPRSLAAFRREGMVVVPFPAFIKSGYGRPLHPVYDFIPDAGALAMTSAVLKERLGLLFYCLGGT
jgi:uncharacterized SAM-binding protein YcdF (DUF218 family)